MSTQLVAAHGVIEKDGKILVVHRSATNDYKPLVKHNLTVITSESHESQHSPIKPKIPNVCDQFDVKWVNLPEYFEAEGL